MKKICYVFVAMSAILLVGCGQKETPTPPSQMGVYVRGIGDIRQDTTIVVTDAIQSLSGEMQMEVVGEVTMSISPLKMIITRSATDRIDEFCAADKCTICDGEETQELEFFYDKDVPDSEFTSKIEWYAHYILPRTGETDYVVKYQFINFDRQLTLTVHYDYQQSE